MNEYSSDTKKVAAKLAGMTDACANVHDDERYDYPWHLCPAGWWGAATLKSGQRYFSEREVAESGEVRVIDNNGATEGWQNSVTRIPEREAELNWWADNYSSWADVVDMTLPAIREAKGIGKGIWQSRRQQRIAFGLIDVNDTDVVDTQDSQQTRIADAIMSEVGCDEVGYSQCVAAAEKIMELTQDSQQEWVNGLPSVGTECECYNGGKWELGQSVGPYLGGWLCMLSSTSQPFVGVKGDFRPIQPEQKPDDRAGTIATWTQLVSDTLSSNFTMTEAYGVIYDSLKDAGRLTQGGGDE